MRQLILGVAFLTLAMGCGGPASEPTPATPTPDAKAITDMDFESGAANQPTAAATMDFESGEAGTATGQGDGATGGQ